MSIKVKFPNDKEFDFEQGRPVVILGANGSGKTRLSVRIEELNDMRFHVSGVSDDNMLIHRISAQKSLTISDTIMVTGHDSSRRAVFFGDVYEHATKMGYRYGSNPATHLLNDFDKVLALLFAEENKELQKAHEADRFADKNGKKRPEIITTVCEKATAIWNELLPQRKIDLMGNGVHVLNNNNNYHGKEMSDGERVILYMICQALILPQNSIIIIDEPELHIHKAIVKRLWSRLEKERTDCVFIYITHDLDFAASRVTDKILWVKNYDGAKWEYEFLDTLEFNALSDELLFEIIGTRRKILFVEGERNSYDNALYSEFFKDKDYHIIPCGGCSDVIRIYKAKKAYEKLSSIEAYCLIDRDFRTDREIAALEADGVKFLNVAEVENLFVVPALLDIMGEQLGCQPDASKQAKDFIIYLFNQTKAGQIGESFIKEIKHQLAILDLEDKPMVPDEIQFIIASKFSVEKIQGYFDEKQRLFDAIITIDDILKVYNFKDLRVKIGLKLGLQGNTYPQRVLNLLKSAQSEIRKQIIDALKPYIPELP